MLPWIRVVAEEFFQRLGDAGESRDHVRVDDRIAERGQVVGRGGLARADATRDNDSLHANTLTIRCDIATRPENALHGQTA